MKEYVVGSTAKLIANVENETEQAANPTALTLLITLPDGSAVSKVIDDFTLESTGKYVLRYLVTQLGEYALYGTATGTGIGRSFRGRFKGV